LIISETQLFKGIDFEILNEVADICTEESYTKGTVLFKYNEDAECLYILIGGTLNLVIKNGGTLTFRIDEPGEVFGWSSMVESGKYTASAVCATDLQAIKIERDKLNKIFNIHPDAGLTVLKRFGGVFSKRLSNAYRNLLSSPGTDSTPSYG
jgi:CRP/FNR family cyclic AMP-dependent transcriptional regulator